MLRQKNIVFAAFASMLALTAGCSDEPDENTSQIEVKIPEKQNKFLQITDLPTANYTEFDGDIYMYETSPSEKEISEGKVLGSISQFKYLGQDKYGFHKIGLFLDEYGIISVSRCKNPCKVIYSSDGKIPYNNKTIIGSVFEDALNGRLSIAKKYSYLDEQEFNEDVLTKRTSSMPKEFRCRWFADGYNGRTYSFSIEKEKGNSMLVFNNSRSGFVYDIQHINIVKLRNADGKLYKIYDIIFSGNQKKLKVAFDWKSKKILGKTSDNQWTEFTAKDCRKNP